MSYGYRIVYGAAAQLTAAGYGKVAKFPFVFDSRPGYHRLGNQFLIDRGLGLWHPKTHGTQEAVALPTKVSLKNYADRLANFLEWCEARAIEPFKIEYTRDLIGRYQGEMLKGVWSRDNSPLADGTINGRIDIAVEYLTWAADKGFRASFQIQKVTRPRFIGSHKSAVSHLPVFQEGRKGKLRDARKRLIGMPTYHEVGTWLKCIAEVKGPTAGLICELILWTAIRRAEAAAWRVDTLPLDRADWKIPNSDVALEYQSVLVELRYGTKGREFGTDNGDKIGPRGTIRVPMPIALKIDQYRKTLRSEALKVAIQQGSTIADYSHPLRHTFA